jgi:hypothetical protein
MKAKPARALAFAAPLMKAKKITKAKPLVIKAKSPKNSAPTKELQSLNVKGLGKHGLGLCQGDCDRNSDCASGLVCGFRHGFTAISGCSGKGKKGWDYCVHPSLEQS